MNMQGLQELLAIPPAQRNNFEIRSVMDWLRTRVNIFKRVKDTILIKLVKECTTVSKEQHELVIREGDIGDCMYILISGFLHIYRRETGDNDEEKRGRRPRPVGNPNVTFYPDRNVLGEDIVVLNTPGAVFGEVALIEDIPRTASVIADTRCVLLVVQRDLYDRTVRSVIEAEFQAKLSFINNNPLFKHFNFKLKNQLAMSLEVVNYEYDGALVRQGQKCHAIFFILQGEVCLTADPFQHLAQFPNMETLSAPAVRNEEGRARFNRNRAVEIALLDGQDAIKSSCVGDIECLLGLETYVCTATSTQNTVALRLTFRSFDRMVAKRSPQVLPQMRAIICRRFDAWLPRSGPLLPLLDLLRRRLAREGGPGTELPDGRDPDAPDALAILRRRTRTSWRQGGGGRSRRLVLPRHGPLIDQAGPGTVFHYIRQREKLRKERGRERTSKRSPAATTEEAADGIVPEEASPATSGAATAKEEESEAAVIPVVKLDPPSDTLTGETAMSSLEEKLREFLDEASGHQLSPAKPHIVKLARYNPEEARAVPKAGYVVMMRPKRLPLAPVSSPPSPSFRLPQLAAALSSILRPPSEPTAATRRKKHHRRTPFLSVDAAVASPRDLTSGEASARSMV